MLGDWPLSTDEIRSLHLEKQIGEGSYGKVYQAQLPSTQALYAVKVMEISIETEDAVNPKETNAYKTMEQEVNVLRACINCTQIVQVLGVEVITVGNQPARLNVVMELCEFGSVSDVLRKLQGPLKEQEIRIIAAEVLKGLQYLHDGKKIHRDVKAGNILLTTSFQAKLADFGISCQLQNTWARRNTQIGSPYWMAPEVIKGEAYNATADIWSLGITCIEMADCQPPYYHIPPTRAMFVISTKPPTGLPESSNSSPDFVAFVSACLTVQSSKRPPAQVLLQYPFIQLSEEEHRDPSKALASQLGPRLAEAPGGKSGSPRQTSKEGARKDSWRRSSTNQTNSLRKSSGQSANLLTQSLAAATPTVDAFAIAAPSSPSSYRRWEQGGYSSQNLSSAPKVAEVEDEDVKEELRRRAREWVNRIVPVMEDEVDNSPTSRVQLDASRDASRETTESLILPSKARRGKANFEVWDSDEEGVATRVRMEAQPEAGAGGPGAATPYFMQVLGKQLA